MASGYSWWTCPLCDVPANKHPRCKECDIPMHTVAFRCVNELCGESHGMARVGNRTCAYCLDKLKTLTQPMPGHYIGDREDYDPSEIHRPTAIPAGGGRMVPSYANRAVRSRR